jgi:2-polyprenyl-3-methyl-5-hydroxy-6-metoxy-1,4-benzoquinol methylase
MDADDDFKRELIRTWDAGADSYDQTPRHGILHDDEWKAWRRLMAAVLGDPAHADVPRLRVLDVGTGTGVLALLAAELGHEVTGLDLSERMLGRARANAADARLAVEWVIGDAETVGGARHGYDALLSRHLLWTLPHPARAMSAWRDAVRPGGLVVTIDEVVPPRPLPIALVADVAGRIVARRSESADHGYSDAVSAQLPLRHQRGTEAVVRLMREAGLERIRVRTLREVDRVERAHLSALERLGDPFERYLATARTPILVAESESGGTP